MTSFDLVAVSGLLIAIIGGIPGIITLWQWFRGRPKPVFVLEEMLLIKAKLGGGDDSEEPSLPCVMMIFVGCLINVGTAPLMLKKPRMQLSCEDNKYLFIPAHVGELAQRLRAMWSGIEYSDAIIDLHCLPKNPEPQDRFYGYYAFINSDLTHEEIERCQTKQHKWTLLFRDIQGGTFSYVLPEESSDFTPAMKAYDAGYNRRRLRLLETDQVTSADET